MARKVRGWFSRLILGEYADAIDHAKDTIDRGYVDRAIRESNEMHSREHENLRAEIEEVRRMIDSTSAEVRAAERAIGVG